MSAPHGRGRGVGEWGTNLFFSFVLKKKKKKSANLHHDFLTNLGEGGLPAWSCLIWSLWSRTNVAVPWARPPHSSPSRPHPRPN